MNSDYRTIAVHVNESRHTLSRIGLASTLAIRFGAHLTGVAATGLPAAYYLGDFSGEGAILVPSYLDVLEDRAKTALAMFDAAAAREGVPSFEKCTLREEPGAALCLQARYSDLLVIGQDDPDDNVPVQPAMISDYVVLHSPVPVLLVPREGEFSEIGGRVLVAWDGSPGATRAVHGALPLLKQAKQVQVAVFDPKAAMHGEEPGADIALFLARHGIEVDVCQQSDAGDSETGSAILSQASDFGADLLVMGGYGHSRFREVILGGATRTVLRSMTIPVLMAH